MDDSQILASTDKALKALRQLSLSSFTIRIELGGSRMAIHAHRGRRRLSAAEGYTLAGMLGVKSPEMSSLPTCAVLSGASGDVTWEIFTEKDLSQQMLAAWAAIGPCGNCAPNEPCDACAAKASEVAREVMGASFPPA
jgi:hypothetical protein